MSQGPEPEGVVVCPKSGRTPRFEFYLAHFDWTGQRIRGKKTSWTVFGGFGPPTRSDGYVLCVFTKSPSVLVQHSRGSRLVFRGVSRASEFVSLRPNVFLGGRSRFFRAGEQRNTREPRAKPGKSEGGAGDWGFHPGGAAVPEKRVSYRIEGVIYFILKDFGYGWVAGPGAGGLEQSFSRVCETIRGARTPAERYGLR